MTRLSGAYRQYHASPAWAAAKERHWRNPLTLKSCVVCGARRGERPLDHHELLYRTIGRGPNRVMVDPPWWAIVPACAHPCHRWLITPLSHHPAPRLVLFAALAWLTVWAGAPILWTTLAYGALVLLPRIPEATALCFLIGLPVRLVRMVVRWCR